MLLSLFNFANGLDGVIEKSQASLQLFNLALVSADSSIDGLDGIFETTIVVTIAQMKTRANFALTLLLAP